MGYSIWLEFEEYANPEDNDDGFCNISVTYDDGRHQGFNVWTIDHFRQRVPEILEEAEKDGYYTMPDLLVSRLEREHITEVLKKVLPP